MSLRIGFHPTVRSALTNSCSGLEGARGRLALGRKCLEALMNHVRLLKS